MAANMARVALFLALSLALAAVAAAVPATHVRSDSDSVFDPLRTAPLALASTQVPVDRVYEYSKDFRLDELFSVDINAGESVLLPFEPIRDRLFPQDGADTTKLAVGLELSVCDGNVLTYVAKDGNRTSRFSSAMYQCVTLTAASDQSAVDLCPLVHSDQQLAMRVNLTSITGFVLHAKVGASANVVAVLRSTKDRGAYKQAFFVGDPSSPAVSRTLNVTSTSKATELSFESALVWDASLPNSTSKPCENCEYALYADMVPPLNESLLPDRRPPPPHCIIRDATIKYMLPATSSGVIQRVALAQGFADQFQTSGDYRFVLVASLPSSNNNGHVAMMTYIPTRVNVTAPSHFVSHLFIVIVVAGVIALLFFVAVKSEVPRRLWGDKDRRDTAHDDESVRLLAQVLAEHAEKPSDHDREEEEKVDEPVDTLLDVIRKTKERETPQPSPRAPTSQGVTFDGYHEIN